MDNFNKDELQPHPWMNLEFFEEVLQKIENANYTKILDFKISPATAKGDHYASVMFRVIITYLTSENTEKKLSMVMKTLPEQEGAKQDLLKGSKIFETEIRMFEEIIPKFEEMLEAIGDKTTLAAKILYSSLSPKKVIILEDISEQGYTTVGQRMANLDEVKMAMDKLAKWHACSYFMNIESEGYLETFQDGVFIMPGIEANEMCTKGVHNLTALAKETPQLQKYVPKLEKINDKMFEKCTKIYDLCKTQGKLNVLAHGDFHGKNLMFRFAENGSAKEVILVDFQLSVWGSMALDLLYCRYMMMDTATRTAHADELTYHFFQNFLDTLKRLGFKGELPKYSDLQTDILHLGHFELFMASTFLPFMHAIVTNTDLDPDDVMSSNDVMFGIYKTPTYIADIEVLLKQFLHKGHLDGYDDDE